MVRGCCAKLAAQFNKLAKCFEAFDDLPLKLFGRGIVFEIGCEFRVDGGGFLSPFFGEVDAKASLVVFVLATFDEAALGKWLDDGPEVGRLHAQMAGQLLDGLSVLGSDVA